MKTLLFLPLLLSLSWTVLLVAADETPWSKADHGLRGRLWVLPPEKADSPFCRVFLELENTENAMGQRKIRFTPERLHLRIADKEGRPVPTGPVLVYDGMSPDWLPMLLPYGGTLKFQISFPGAGYNPRTDKVIVDLGAAGSWIILQNLGFDCYLTGTFSVAEEKGDYPYMDWSGTIQFPLVKIPRP